ncbi:MAG: hypothetical protein ACI8UD_000923, partial [Planctomycetota bacterium]
QPVAAVRGARASSGIAHHNEQFVLPQAVPAIDFAKFSA